MVSGEELGCIARLIRRFQSAIEDEEISREIIDREQRGTGCRQIEEGRDARRRVARRECRWGWRPSRPEADRVRRSLYPQVCSSRELAGFEAATQSPVCVAVSPFSSLSLLPVSFCSRVLGAGTEHHQVRVEGAGAEVLDAGTWIDGEKNTSVPAAGVARNDGGFAGRRTAAVIDDHEVGRAEQRNVVDHEPDAECRRDVFGEVLIRSPLRDPGFATCAERDHVAGERHNPRHPAVPRRG